jgi:hypothetical protein
VHSAAAKCDFARPGALGRAPGDGARLAVAASVIGRALRSLAGGGGVTPVIRDGPSWYKTSQDALCQMLRQVLDGAQVGRGAAGGIGSVECRAVVTLYSLLRDHPVDQWGRCRSCRRPGSVLGSRWRPCQVHSKATLCLRQLDEVLLLSLLADE